MTQRLRDLEVLALDCQASGASPAYGDVLELGWARCDVNGALGSIESRWIVPRTARRVGRAVRELTGWSEACLAEAVEEQKAWQELAALARLGATTAPSVIHFARFELSFLRDLHARLEPETPFPIDAVCLHAVAQRLFPDLPRKNIRALAGFLGHSPELLRRSAGHVEATAFIWHALVPRLEEAGITTWQELGTWLADPARTPRSTRRSFPLDPERRRSLPDASGVYRFLRKNGDVIYVGKAASLKKRVASHFKSRGPATERGLELLTQVHDIEHTETPSILEAALLECDEIKRLDPPYNVQLRTGERSAWFASRDFRDAASAPDGAHGIGPLPSERALSPLVAAIALLEGAEPSPARRAAALAVPAVFAPDEALFVEGFRAFVAELVPAGGTPRARLVAASRALWLERGRSEAEPGPEERAPDEWDLARVRRRLERNVVGTGLLLRRARFLCLLVDANVAFRESERREARGLTIVRGEIAERRALGSVIDVGTLPRARPRALFERLRAFDSAAAYDRLRTLLTELRRVRDEGGEIALRVGAHVWTGARLTEATREI